MAELFSHHKRVKKECYENVLGDEYDEPKKGINTSTKKHDIFHHNIPDIHQNKNLNTHFLLIPNLNLRNLIKKNHKSTVTGTTQGENLIKILQQICQLTERLFPFNLNHPKNNYKRKHLALPQRQIIKI